MTKRMHVPGFSRVIATVRKDQLPIRKVWATQRANAKGTPKRGYHPCIWGTRADAQEGKDYDEVVVQIEYRIVKALLKTGRRRTWGAASALATVPPSIGAASP